MIILILLLNFFRGIKPKSKQCCDNNHLLINKPKGKGLEPKFIQVSKDPNYSKLPLLFAQMSVQDNKEFIKSLGVLALPSVHIYAGVEGLVENFPCGPSKVPILKKKIAQVVNTKVDKQTLQASPTLKAGKKKVTIIAQYALTKNLVTSRIEKNMITMKVALNNFVN